MQQDNIPQPDRDSQTPMGQLSPYPPTRAPHRHSTHMIPVARPPFRRLRAYAFDPSLSRQLEHALVNAVTIKVPWECDPVTGKDILQPGPVGEYLEVVDFDPASDCFYAPVDLNQPYLLAQDGLEPSEGNPQFHQQMVYAVAMTTIGYFEQALGRTVFWAPHHVQDDNEQQNNDQGSEVYIQRLRIYPHALREANAYYSPQKKALLFGYFPAASSDPQYHLQTGIVFTCLSHDVIAHETTHALLDGIHPYFTVQTNPDVLAFHEAFADNVALFQHFSFPEVLSHQIAKTRGDLGSENLLAQLAQELGQAIGSHGALRDALGSVENGTWKTKIPDPTEIERAVEPHVRGSLLVAAVFDAFVSIYKSRIADLLRIATGGTGVLPAGQLHPDLVNRMANEAAKTAQHLLTMCIRALDYCPPVDITFGDYLRALITADDDLVRDDTRSYRIAVVEAFRRYGIFPRDVRSLSVESLRWQEPTDPDFHPLFLPIAQKVSHILQDWNLFSRHEEVYEAFRQKRLALHEWLKGVDHEVLAMLGLEVGKPGADFEVHSLRPVRRVGPHGELLVEVVIEITQQKAGYFDEQIQEQVDSGRMNPPPSADFTFYGGCSLLVDPITSRVRYCIVKNISSQQRLARQRAFLQQRTDHSLRALYFRSLTRSDLKEPFAFVHRSADEEQLL